LFWGEGERVLGNYLIAKQKNVKKFQLATNKETANKQAIQLTKADPRQRKNKLPQSTSHPFWQRTGILATPSKSPDPSWETGTISHRLHGGSERHITLTTEKG